MKIAFVHTYGNAWYSKAIKKISGGEFNHSLVMVEVETMKDFAHLGLLASRDSEKRFYFESYWKKDPYTKKTGVHGPIVWSELEEWIARKPKKRGALIQWIECDDEMIAQVVDALTVATSSIAYPLCQLLSNARTALFGSGMRRKDITRDRWTCSETVARMWKIIDAESLIDCLDIGNTLFFDMVMPSGRNYGLKEAVSRWGRCTKEERVVV